MSQVKSFNYTKEFGFGLYVTTKFINFFFVI